MREEEKDSAYLPCERPSYVSPTGMPQSFQFILHSNLFA